STRPLSIRLHRSVLDRNFIMQSKATTVAEYLKELPADRREALKIVRALIKKHAPDAVESMQFGMPAYSMGDVLCGLASQKNNMALYICDTPVVDAHRSKLGRLNCGKG